MEYIKPYLDYASAFDYISFDALIYLVVAIVLLFVGKLMYDMLTPFSINKELGDRDNPALALSYTGYIVAQAIIILGILLSPEQNLILDIIATVVWSLVGILLLNVSLFINDKIILSKFDNVKEIVQDKNVGTPAVQMGSLIGSAFVIQSVIRGESEGIVADAIGVAVFYVLAQAAFILFGIIYQKMTTFDIHEAIEQDNVAAGVAFGMSLVAIGVIISHIITLTDSLPAFLVWFVNGVALIVLTRVLVDKIVLPKHKLDHEISHDRNWGVALVEGGSAIMIAFIINASF